MHEYPWVKHYPEEIDWNQPVEPHPVYKILDDTAARFPDNCALDFLDKRYSYRQLQELVEKAAAGFRSIGVENGTKVGLFLPNTPHFVISYFAILKAGGIVVNFSPLYSVRELKYQLEDSETEIIITLNLEALYPKAKELLGHGRLRKLIIGNMPEILPFPKNLLFPFVKRKEIADVKWDDDHIKWQDLLAHPPSSDNPQTSPDSIAVIQYTGGTTGTPKGAVLTHHNVYTNAVQTGLWFGALEDGGEIMLGVLPFFHVFAMTAVMNFSMLKGARLIMHPRFELKHVLKDIDRKKPTLMPGVPTMFSAIINHPKLAEHNLSSLKACISGGAPLPVEVKQRFEKLTGCSLIEGYGLTETSPVVCANPLYGKNKAGSIGLPLPQTIVEIEDMENRGQFLGIGEKGELCVRAPQVMQGYWQKPDETAAVLDEAGRLRTGDIAYIDKEGYVFIADRLKELIIAGGFNIYPRNVEEAIYLHDAILEAAVVGIPDPYRGQTVKAFVALKDGAKLDAAELKEFLQDKLGRHEIPTHIEFRDELPKTMIGKISKKDL